MGTRVSIADVKQGAPVVVSAQDMTAAIAAAANEVAIVVGDNINNRSFRMQVDRAIQEIHDFLREGGWPQGPAATNSAHELTVLITKTGIVPLNGVNIPAASLSESSIAIIYGTSDRLGSSGLYQSSVTTIRDFIRQSLSDG